ncbi:MAG: exodeoxyribonuclease V subunit alpha [Pseudomonadales bacterium]|nr:exodeoxyribonuclease V subunit alpha [Pseudomonadales bacterium]
MSNSKNNPLHPSTVLAQLKRLYKAGVIRAIDYQFARFLSEQHPQETNTQSQDGITLLLGALVSYQLGAGHSCINLNQLPLPLFGLRDDAEFNGEEDVNNPVLPSPVIPEKETVIRILAASPLVCCETEAHEQGLDRPEIVAPLRLEGSRLYLYRYWRYEFDVAKQLKHMLGEGTPENQSNPEIAHTLRDALERLFPQDKENPWPKVAASLALKNRLLLISGGPGTGKTTTVTRTLALLLEQAAAENKNLSIQLAAPTGKAAARLSESIAAAKSNLNAEATILEKIPDQAKTLHRLLGVIPGSISFRFNRQNRLHLDLLLVDEASMIDLPMMFALLSALPDHARLILLGDKDQLASVEPGSVLADLCVHSNNTYSPQTAHTIKTLTGCDTKVDSQLPENSLANSICQLQKSYRFHQDSGIGDIARRVNAGDKKVIESYWRKENEKADVCIFPFKEAKHLRERAAAHCAEFIKACQQGDTNTSKLFEQFTRFQILCATREGELSVAAINRWMEDKLHQQGLINKHDWYIGCPVMISQNSYRHQLYNGDIGICLNDPNNLNQPRIYFPPLDAMQDDSPRSFLPSRLPPFEKVYAMTVHKSQGSEFDEVMMVYPPQDSPVLTRELLYTGITRAKKKCFILGDKAVLKASIQRKTWRDSGLAQRL